MTFLYGFWSALLFIVAGIWLQLGFDWLGAGFAVAAVIALAGCMITYLEGPKKDLTEL